MSKKKNPLYVVTNKGKDVETALNFFDVLIKKFNLQPVIELLKVFLNILNENVKSYATFVAMKKWVEELLAPLMLLMAKFQKT